MCGDRCKSHLFRIDRGESPAEGDIHSGAADEFLCPKYVMVELFKHKERTAASTGLDEDSLLALLHSLLERIRFFDEDAISIGSWAEAWRLCRDVDENDVAYVALTLEVDGDL